MKLFRTSLIVVVVTAAALGSALPKFFKDFQSTYNLKKDGTLVKASCGACHIGKTKKLNPYGLSLETAMKAEKTRILTGSVLKKVEGLDSDKDGVANLKEIEGDTLPGDPKSK
jgi:hypothetical protein